MAENQSQSPGTQEQYPVNALTEPSIGVAYDKQKDTASVLSQNPDGSIGEVEPTPENENLFFIMDKQIPVNFYKNLQKYHNNPAINIYVLPRRALDRVKEALKRYRHATTSDDVKVLYNYKMRPDGQFECKVKTHGIRDNEMPWDTLARFGLSYGALERTGNLQRLRNYEPTTMLKLAYSDDIISNMVGDAKLRLKGKGENVKLVLKFSTKNPAKKLFNVPFSEEDLKTLASTGNLGHVLHTPVGPLLVSRDFDTQQYDWINAEKAYIPNKLYGNEVPKETIDAFRNGEARTVPIKGEDGQLREVLFQYNAIFNKVMQVLTKQQRNELASQLRNKSDVERIISHPGQEQHEQPKDSIQTQHKEPAQTQQPATTTEQTTAQSAKQTARQGQKAEQGQKPAPRPQVKAAEARKGQRSAKHM